jgi:hypothetical protein
MIYFLYLSLVGAAIGYFFSTTIVLILTALVVCGCMWIWQDAAGQANGDAGLAAAVLTGFAASLALGAWAMKLILYIWPHIPHIQVLR